jgi:hypothetical protein
MKEEILKLKNGECYTVPESDYGKAEVWKVNNYYVLFSIPTFGGNPAYESTNHETLIDHIVETINSWT